MRTRTAGPITPSEKSHHLVRRLASRDAEEHRIAKDEFLRMATDDPALFHADLADIIKAITGDRRRTWRCAAVMIVSLYPLMLITAALTEGSERIIVPLAWTAATLVSTGVISSTIFQTLLYARRKQLAEAIGDIDDLNALPALIELLEFTNPAVRNAILPPITRLLSRLRASDAHLLGFLHRSALARTLSTPRARKLPASFFVSVLQAFEQIGDSQVLPAVSWLAQGKGVAGDHPMVQEAAQTCQGHLEEMLRRHQAPYLLLRPSSVTEASHALLRPVAGAPDDAPHELLRPDNPLRYTENMLKTYTDKPNQANDQRHLIQRLGSRDATERDVARAEFLSLATEDPSLFHADLAAIIKAMSANGKRTAIRLSILLGISYVLLCLLPVVMAIMDASTTAGLLIVGILVGLPATACVGIGASWVINRSRAAHLAECTADIDDLNALPALIDLLEFTSPNIRAAILPPITRLLTRLQPSDARLLVFRHQSTLARTFSTPRMRKLPDTFFLAALQALEQVGDSQVLPAVAWLAQGKGVAATHPSIREAAQTCEAQLQARLSRHLTAATLLRPSSAAEAPHILLRPVVSAPDTAPHELLRPDNSPREQTVPVMIRPQGLEPEILFNTLQRPENPENR